MKFTLTLLLATICVFSFAQKETYTPLEDALKNPEEVTHLRIFANKGSIGADFTDFAQFPNLKKLQNLWGLLQGQLRKKYTP